MARPPVIPKALKEAVRGLSFPSETDAPVEAFAWPAGPIDKAAIRAAAGVGPKVKVEELTLAELFRGVPAEARASFVPLLVAIIDHLSGVKVFKVGEVTIPVFVVGKLVDGNRAGVKTQVVET